MPTFHFFEKDDVILHLNITSHTFEVEKEQLSAQGFKQLGDAVEAANSQLAYDQFNNIQSGKKAIFHFFEKDELILHLNIDSPSFLTEKEQLVEQGFERIGDPVHAQTNQQAHQKFKQMQLDEMNTSTTFLGAATSGGAGNFLHFVSKVKEKSEANKK
ncbi:hypothetical protein [Psychromonas sp. Urea-02u-13]|uniref:hypothetical protein n=1 Tax=Psychromonas sp. Urea-02u-13 TaxID=2058326 RepID=UPI000C335D61|nr:hypothetical protein [Psychromonas sp. Urea-02u-13]PKG40509.1 hypothetical protein CXF74_02660 [Psychromonas sp. Urea-02u-13]